ncbi:MAG TPA: alpha-glucosidase [Clostridiales bacterium]|jgi:oligo-1,6-glucosidase|nr:alpha-glucosidase [Clostridiales bacterium]
MKRTRWYKDAFIYQIYPRSFCDSNGDGIGDLRGIISKLDYLKELGVTAVWLSPCYKSPNDDNGYDISDYRDIMDEFGTLEDWEEMVEGMHKRGIKLIMDLVVNHTSDEHYWFQEARKSKDNPYRDYYIWRKGKGKNGKKPPNNWTSRFGGSAWEYCEETDEYYLHLFTKKQPDLNWKNPKVRQEVHDIVKYWLDKGCDGFRCDVITYIAKEDGLPDGRWNIALRGDEHFNNHPTIHSYLHALNKEVLSNYDCMTVGEGPGMNVENAIKYTSEENEELDTVFTFEHMNTDTYFQLIPRKFKLSRLKKVFAKYQHGLRNKGWNSLYFENHDQPRCLPRFVGDYGPYRKQAAKMLAVALYMQQGTPYIYQGQEIGMTNYPWKSLDEFQDVMVKYVMGVINKIAPFLKGYVFKVMKWRARDNARTPMQWNDEENAGFTTGKPWLPVNPNYKEINVADAMKDEDSIFHFYKKLIRFRLGNKIIIHGTFRQMYEKSNDIYCYERSYEGQRLMVICNFKNKEVGFKLPAEVVYDSAELVLHNYDYDRKLEDMKLRPYEAMIFLLK